MTASILTISALLLSAGLALSLQTPWVVQLPPSPSQETRGIAATADSVFVAGSTVGPVFQEDYQYYYGGSTQAFAARLDPADGSVIWGIQKNTYYSSEANAVASYGDLVYVVGSTSGSMYNNNFGRKDYFVTAYSVDGGSEKWGFQAGSSEDDVAFGVAANERGVYVCGSTAGSLYTSLGGKTDAFVVKLNLAGRNLVGVVEWGTQIYEAYDNIGLTIQPVGALHLELYISNQNSEVIADYMYLSPVAVMLDEVRGQVLSSTTVPERYNDNSAIGDHSKYTFRMESSSIISKNPCQASTYLDMYASGTGTPMCAPCQTGSYSEDYMDYCWQCWEGRVSTNGKTCDECPAGTYSTSGASCDTCPAMTWSMEGSWRCKLFSWRIATDNAEISSLYYIFLSAVVGVGLLLFFLELPKDVCGVIMLSTVNVLSAQLYAAISFYFMFTYMYMSLVFLLIPVCHYIYRVLRICGPKNGYQLRIMLKRPLIQAPLICINMNDGLLRWNSTSVEVVDSAGASSPSVSDSFFSRTSHNVSLVAMQTIYVFGWVIFHFFYFAPWYIFHVIFFSSFFAMGFYLYICKLLFVPSVLAWWLEWIVGNGPLSRTWTAAANVDRVIDLPAMNAAFFVEVVLASCPLFILQAVNTQRMKGTSYIAFLSLGSAGLSISVHVFRVLYWHVWKRVSLLYIPVWSATDDDINPYIEGEEVNLMLSRSSEYRGSSEGAESGREKSGADSDNPLIVEMKETNRRLMSEQENMKKKLALLERVILHRNSAPINDTCSPADHGADDCDDESFDDMETLL